ncbi:hypothetical protein DOTSEDRAFT_25338 [Dothistroma septosporum NZE10]|uniref:Uncharacterized protein n=1 Tax=Dothistroma septosporum (strain NZE10 / CBS 128990) TaxID=675120 RepID=M2WN11_DOTSN|nr:hypothetical protein DOTSEDRAFT_25338 [Dothistroma septosporum NZE10]
MPVDYLKLIAALMCCKQLVLAIVAVTVVAAGGPDIQSSDFPQAYRSTCGPAMPPFNQCNDRDDNTTMTTLGQTEAMTPSYPVNSQNGGNNRGNEVHRWMQYCGLQQQNNGGTTTGTILPPSATTSFISSNWYSPECRTWVYTSTLKNNGNQNNNGIGNTYLATSIECSNQASFTGGDYGSTTSWTTEPCQTIQNGQVYQQTALVGVVPDGARQTFPADAGNTIPGVGVYGGAAPTYVQPYSGAAGGFLMAASAL